jgi:hypothetical protein
MTLAEFFHTYVRYLIYDGKDQASGILKNINGLVAKLNKKINIITDLSKKLNSELTAIDYFKENGEFDQEYL